MQKAYFGLNQVQSGSKEETLKNAMQDPEVQSIMADPVMQTILKQMQEDPRAAQEYVSFWWTFVYFLISHMKNPAIAGKIRTLINAGIIQTR